MSLIISQQTAAFLGSLFLGAVLGAVFDLFRVFRKAFCQPVWLIWAEDVLYLLICAVITYGYMLQSIEGQVRVFIIIGELIGAILYYLTLGRLVMAVSLILIAVIRNILHFLYLVIIRPILFVLRFIGKIFSKINHKLSTILKNYLQKLKYVLKAWGNVLYNCFKNIKSKLVQKRKGKANDKE